MNNKEESEGFILAFFVRKPLNYTTKHLKYIVKINKKSLKNPPENPLTNQPHKCYTILEHLNNCSNVQGYYIPTEGICQ